MDKKSFKPKTKKGKFMSEYFKFRGMGNDHKTALHNARVVMDLETGTIWS